MNANVSIPTLHDGAMLVYVQLRVWSARKLDRKQTAKTVVGAKATGDSARVNKHLLASADSKLKDVQRVANRIRAFIETKTLPWDDAGNRIISNAQALVLVGEADRLRQEFNDAVDSFVEEYPVLRAQALVNLGEMANDDDYPQPDQVRAKFGVKLSFNPLPTGFNDFRTGMSEAQARAWQSHFEANVQSQVSGALANAWERLRENLQHYSDRLKLKDDGSGKTEIFRDTMVTNLRETVDLLDSLNVFNDPQLRATTALVRKEISVHDPAALRENVGAAMLVKQQADDVLRNINALLGL